MKYWLGAAALVLVAGVAAADRAADLEAIRQVGPGQSRRLGGYFAKVYICRKLFLAGVEFQYRQPSLQIRHIHDDVAVKTSRPQ